MSQRDNRVRNWRQYNKALVKRGDITLWIDVESWRRLEKSSKLGRPPVYSDSAIATMLVIKSAFRLTLRACEGFVRSIFRSLNLDFHVPDYTTICRRQKTVKLPAFPNKPGAIHLVVDSSGLKIFGEGEWRVKRHGHSKHRMWRKIHIGVDESTQMIVSAVLTENSCGDNKVLEKVLNNYRGPLAQVSADGGYDSHACFEEIHKRGAKAVIPTQPNPKHPPKIFSKLKRPRDYTFWEIQTKGRTQWKKESNYHRRSLVETAFYRFKQLTGEKLSARKFENQTTEALVKCHVLNKMMKLSG